MIDIIVLGVVLIFVLGSVAYMRKAKKEGKSSCGCSCENCKLSCSSLKLVKDEEK